MSVPIERIEELILGSRLRLKRTADETPLSETAGADAVVAQRGPSGDRKDVG